MPTQQQLSPSFLHNLQLYVSSDRGLMSYVTGYPKVLWEGGLQGCSRGEGKPAALWITETFRTPKLRRRELGLKHCAERTNSIMVCHCSILPISQEQYRRIVGIRSTVGKNKGRPPSEGDRGRRTINFLMRSETYDTYRLYQMKLSSVIVVHAVDFRSFAR